MPSAEDTGASGHAPRASAAQVFCARLRRMGLRARLMQGGRAAIATLPLSPQPFPALERSLRLEQVMFSTVGRSHIKCLKPESLFALPMIDVSRCESAADLEARIRAAWRTRIEALGPLWEGLRALGAGVRARDPDTVLRLPVEGEAGSVEARLIGGGRLILPGRGPLGGVALAGPAERTLALGRLPGSAVELQIAISNRLEELAATARRREKAQRDARVALSLPEPSQLGVRTHRILLVGSRLTQDRGVADSLRLRGYEVLCARSTTEALRSFARCSPELVLTDADLGRNEGLELVPMLATLAGVDHIPVIVVDATKHPGRRAAARDVGAVGYLVHPLDVAKIAPRLAEMVDQPARRRFTRYLQQVAVRLEGSRLPATTTALSRGGLYVATDADLQAQSLQRCELVLTATGQSVQVEAEVRYRLGNGGRERRGVGLRFERFGAGGEAAYLEFLRALEGSAEG